MTVWLRVDMEKSGQTTKESLKKLWTKPAVILFLFVFTLGYGWGVRDTYLFAYLQDELGASSSLISKSCSAPSINGVRLAQKQIMLGRLRVPRGRESKKQIKMWTSFMDVLLSN